MEFGRQAELDRSAQSIVWVLALDHCYSEIWGGGGGIVVVRVLQQVRLAQSQLCESTSRESVVKSAQPPAAKAGHPHNLRRYPRNMQSLEGARCIHRWETLCPVQESARSEELFHQQVDRGKSSRKKLDRA